MHTVYYILIPYEGKFRYQIYSQHIHLLNYYISEIYLGVSSRLSLWGRKEQQESGSRVIAEDCIDGKHTQ